MPVRRNVVHRLVVALTGGLVFDGLRVAVCKTVPDEVYEDGRQAADTLYCEVVEQVDWSRILIEAQGRHLQHDLNADSYTTCGKCLRVALLVDDYDAYRDAEPAPSSDHPDWLSGLSLLRSRVREAKARRAVRGAD